MSVRVVGGRFGGVPLKVPKTGNLRPTQDRVREALFNILCGDIPGCDFLDLFAGTGAVGIEALSRGARSATFVERDRRHLVVLKANVESVAGGCEWRSVTADAYAWIASYAGPGFSVAFADPPYALGEDRGYAHVLSTLAERGVVRPGGVFVAEMTAVQGPAEAPGWELLLDRTYGKTRLCVWRRAAAPTP